MNFLKRFWSFDRLLGVDLVKLIYYFGLAAIVVGIAVGMMLGVVTMTSADLGQGFVQLVAFPVVGAVVIVYWRFLCEFFMVVFQMNDRLGDLRDTVMGTPPPAPDPNAPQF